MRKLLTIICLTICFIVCEAQHPRRMAFASDTIMAHDPVMAYENGTYYLLSTGIGIQWATSTDRKTWIVQPTPYIEHIPTWTHDSVSGFRNHVWAPDIIKWHDHWWLTYSCSTFGKNTSAIGLMSSSTLNGTWKDEGCIVASKENRDQWNAIDPNFVIDDQDCPWMTWGSFWDGIQLAPMDTTMHLTANPITIARRYQKGDPNAADNPTSKYAGKNAIEAPFIFKHGGYYYLFVSWDYCCRGSKSNYRVAVGRSKKISGPYLDKKGQDMLLGGGTIFLEGDKKEYEATGHCSVYDFDGLSWFVCHGYATKYNGNAILIQRPIKWTADQWPYLE